VRFNKQQSRRRYAANGFALSPYVPCSRTRHVCAFAWIQWQRRILVRWEYHSQNFLGFVQLACLVILFKRF
jgi:hypothetical protein